MIVCICARVTDRQIRQAAADGADSLECLQLELGLALQCGRCAECACRVMCEAANAPAAMPTAHAPARVVALPRNGSQRHSLAAAAH